MRPGDLRAETHRILRRSSPKHPSNYLPMVWMLICSAGKASSATRLWELAFADVAISPVCLLKLIRQLNKLPPARKVGVKERLREWVRTRTLARQWDLSFRDTVLGFLALAAVLGLFLLLLHFGECFFAPLEIDQERTRILHVTRHHWLWLDEEIQVEARRFDGKWQWCRKDKKGDWHPYLGSACNACLVVPSDSQPRAMGSDSLDEEAKCVDSG
jgi:hypothetical protein